MTRCTTSRSQNKQLPSIPLDHAIVAVLAERAGAFINADAGSLTGTAVGDFLQHARLRPGVEVRLHAIRSSRLDLLPQQRHHLYRHRRKNQFGNSEMSVSTSEISDHGDENHDL